MKKRILWLCLLMVAALQAAIAANIEVKGTVLDDADEPVVGAAVNIKGTTQGVQTDINGHFHFPSLAQGTVLTITYVGMEPVEVKAQPNMTVRLKPSQAQLETVIVTAFGTAKKSAFTGSAAVLTSDKIEQKQVTNVMSSLMGEVPGLDINPTTAPGTSQSIVIRGKGTINAGTDPLIIVDGMPFDGSWNHINPQDVDNITVLKDAASSALYGARGANGVILITTKKGQVGKAIVNLDAKWGANHRARRDYDRIDNPGQYYEAHYQALYNSYVNGGMDPSSAHAKANENLTGSATYGGLGYNIYTVPNGQYLIGTNGRLNPNATLGNRVYMDGQYYTLYPDDWSDNAYRTGLRQEYNLSVSGAGEKYSVFTSIGYLNDEGIVNASKYERYSGRLRATFQPTSWFTIGSNAAYTHSKQNRSYYLAQDNSYVTGGGVFTDVANIAPIYPLYVRDAFGNILQDRNGNVYDWGNGKYNINNRPSLINDNSLQCLDLDYNDRTSNSTAADMFGDITFPYGFKATVKAGVNINENREKWAYNPYYGYNTSTNGYLGISHDRTTTFNFQQLLNWQHRYGESNVQALIGHESFVHKYEVLSASKNNVFDYDNNSELNGYLDFPTAPSSYQTNYNTEGYMLRGMYDFRDRYFFQASFRRDASSRFHPDHRWGNFWSVGGAWIISQESFFHSRVFNNLKIKASYGEVGNDNIGDYRYDDTYLIDNFNGAPALAFSTKGNKDISWETISNFNAGIEFDLFDYRLSGTVEYYYKKSSDMLLWFATPSILGYSGYYKNIGDMRNTGMDLTLTGTPIRTKDLSWTISLNMNYNNQRVTYLPDGNKSTTVEGHGGYQSGNDYFIGEGLPLYTLYIAEYAGVDPATGKGQWYTDADANGVRDVTTDYNLAGRILVNPSQPVKGGFSTALKGYGFDLNVQFVYGLGGKAIDREYSQLMSSPVGNAVGYAYHKDVLDSWTPENPNSDIPRFCYGDQYTGIASTRFLNSLSYLSFQNFQVGYTLPTKLVKKATLTKVRVYVTGDNLYLWSARKGYEPRVSAGYGSYSPMRTISGGINIQF